MDSIAAFMSDTLLLLQTRPAEADTSPAASDKRMTSVADAMPLNAAHNAPFEPCAATEIFQAAKRGASRVSHVRWRS
jgi:hypothetical protein